MSRGKRPCNFVWLCGEAKAASRRSLPAEDRERLRKGEAVGYVDPCVRPAGHSGEHILSTMYYDPAIENEA